MGDGQFIVHEGFIRRGWFMARVKMVTWWRSSACYRSRLGFFIDTMIEEVRWCIKQTSCSMDKKLYITSLLGSLFESKVDIPGVNVDKFDDKYFAKEVEKKKKTGESEFFEAEK
ncbi:uncharacterized protein LOC131165075 [Malania oleifera]|uniref:uncharacterized protein LOC131165075 n=1 Tax=Malania oleifera TaxID=397392 RepID=UPI0025AE2783|nr:uncharacterized protein LOC131165075 [Malania oleifera]